MSYDRIARLAMVFSACLVVASLSFAQNNSAKDTKGAAAKKAAPAAGKGDVKKGKDVFETYCEICHYVENTEKKIGPGLKSVYKRGKFADGKKVDDASMTQWIEAGGKDMPGFKDQISPAEVNNLIAYLRTL